MKIFKPNNMKTAKNLVLLGIVMSAFLSSCTMQKCVYSKGYYVDWFDGKSKKENPKTTDKVSSDELNISCNQLSHEKKEVAQNEAIVTEKVDESMAVASSEDNEVLIAQKDRSKSPVSESISASDDVSSFRNEFKNGVGVIMSPPDDQRTNGMALAGFICSLVGLFIFGVVLGVLGIIFSAIGLGKIAKDSSRWKGKGMAIAGLVVGVVDIILWIILLALIL
jgi:hypothetical protein